MFSTVVTAFVLAAAVNQVAAEPSRARHLYAARAYAQDSHLLEDYDTYHARYLSIGCVSAKKDNKAFFKDCCHPLQKDSDSSAPAKCSASNKQSYSGSSGSSEPSTTAAYTPEPTQNSGSSEVYTGGFATYFYQNGVAGACGTVHSDSDYIVAADYRRYGDLSKQSDLCGKKVLITNTKNGKTVTCTVADACPTCNNGNSLDLSEGAFKAIAPLDDGMVPITYTFV
ncbi:RlpA-like double-psi beta-barrel-protein domain-containing protein-containing protein [Rhizoctonia solani]|nr:RlpA-like double-psi beta-barrel-protein domain-containing protein-containing protein [Rhizoctonia solani]